MRRECRVQGEVNFRARESEKGNSLAVRERSLWKTTCFSISFYTDLKIAKSYLFPKYKYLYNIPN